MSADDAVALHSEWKRWTNTATEELTSYGTRAEAEEAYREAAELPEDAPLEPDRISSFSLCRECARLERAVNVESGYDEWAYQFSEWPCPTARAAGVSA